MPKSKAAGVEPWVDPDDAPELTAEYFARADVYNGETLIRRGRGKQIAPTKTQISLRVDRDVLAAYRATGAGWQNRMNDALKAAIAEKSVSSGKK